MNYLHWDEKIITDFSDKNISDLYDHGYVFTRIGKGVVQQTRSVRIDLSRFEMTSENRRVVKKTDGLEMTAVDLPLREGYDWQLGKLAKDFYDDKFGPGIMSAAKVKEMLTERTKSNFNSLLVYTQKHRTLGYTISYANAHMLHYSYPFYDLNAAPKDAGLGMMIRAIEYARGAGMKYVYLGSLQRRTDTYKLQFQGLEWFDGGPAGSNTWQKDLEAVKKILASASIGK